MDEREIFSHVDHTLLKPDCSFQAIRWLCQEAEEYGAASVCIPSSYVSQARECFPDLRIGTVIGFPWGYCPPAVKVYAARRAVLDGADELDTVIDLGAVKDRAYHKIRSELCALREAAPESTIKVIVETCWLTREEKEDICKVILSTDMDYLKTSTGFGPAGADLADVALFRQLLGKELKIKAAGGIRTKEQMEAFLAAGCDRIGSSNGVKALFAGKQQQEDEK